MLQMGYSVRLNFNWNGDLLFYFLRRAPRPLRDDLHVIVGYVWIRFYRQVVKGNRAPYEQQHRHRQNNEAIIERVFDQIVDHLIVRAFLEAAVTIAPPCSASPKHW